MKEFLIKLRHSHIWKRIFYERLTEPIYLNLISLFVYLFGSYKLKIDYDLIIRQPNAFGILKSAIFAKKLGIRTITLIEFGVAAGAGLLNMAEIARNITKEIGINFKIYGFDTGIGMPPALDYRDHPDLYQCGDFPMNYELLVKNLPDNTNIIIGDISTTIENFIEKLPIDEPIGFVIFDMDYYHSTKIALNIFKNHPLKYLPITVVYLDDIVFEPHNSYCGELLAIHEFNLENEFRKIEFHNFLENERIFRRAMWLKQIYYLHVLDHPTRYDISVNKKKRILENPYFD